MTHARKVASVILGRRFAQQVDDAVQDSVVDLLRKMLSGDPVEDMAAFLTVVVRRRAMDIFRDHSRRGTVALDIDLQSALEDVERTVELRLEAVAAIRALQTVLSPQERQVFLLREYAGLSERETAERLGISVGTVSKALHRGRTKIAAWRGRVRSGRPNIDGRV